MARPSRASCGKPSRLAAPNRAGVELPKALSSRAESPASSRLAVPTGRCRDRLGRRSCCSDPRRRRSCRSAAGHCSGRTGPPGKVSNAGGRRLCFGQQGPNRRSERDREQLLGHRVLQLPMPSASWHRQHNEIRRWRMARRRNVEGPVPTGPFLGSSATRRSLLPIPPSYRPSHRQNLSWILGLLGTRSSSSRHECCGEPPPWASMAACPSHPPRHPAPS